MRTKSMDKLLSEIKREYRILAEYKMIQSEHIPGVYTIPSSESSLIWNGVIFVRTGKYKDGIFRFNISLSEEFPNDSKPPVIIFQKNSIFHPLVNPFTGSMDISAEFSKWEPSTDHLWHVLKYLKFLLENVEFCMELRIQNEEAFSLFNSNPDSFYSKVQECVKQSKEKIYEKDPTVISDKHYLTFDQFDPDTHATVLKNMKISALSGSADNYSKESIA